MRLHRAVVLLLLPLLTGCATARVVRLETDRGEALTFTPRTDEAGPVELEEDEFKEALSEHARARRPPAHPQEAARLLFEMDSRGGTYLFDARTRRVTPLGPGEHVEGEPSEVDLELTRAYLRWCERTGRRGDCLHLLAEGPTVNGDGRYALAMALAQDAVNEEMLDAFKEMADPHAMLAAALWTGTLYLILWTVPEPVSKGLAAVMTATLVVYLGVDTFWGLIAGFRRLVEEADRARTFDELRDAGEQYGKVMGRNAARAFALFATVAIGNTAAGFAGKVPTLPGSAQASMQAGSRAGIVLSAVGEVQAVTVTGEAVTMALASGAVSTTARGMDGAAVGPVDAKGHDHHIATDKWWDSDKNGGPWSPLFQKVFDKAGMSLNDPANIINVKGHKGPHPQEYHQRILNRLTEATEDCRSMRQCREALTSELKRLARQISTPGTELNKLVTRS
ncbi:AHH domain-containing protein [Pyxidicoccus xibeiensis]|uniref:AHH domain-containing protein n=1 Tax=Pyxidicoccus xibeiensis TaxID=2906759 RepID=UPI0020A76B50|nr:AHH domain-containing protein [Pyxidicoccus xibeiensis]MCP3142614.1 AHH domain-containing protein [Pyxidicoccus xibeiensis]